MDPLAVALLVAVALALGGGLAHRAARGLARARRVADELAARGARIAGASGIVDLVVWGTWHGRAFRAAHARLRAEAVTTTSLRTNLDPGFGLRADPGNGSKGTRHWSPVRTGDAEFDGRYAVWATDPARAASLLVGELRSALLKRGARFDVRDGWARLTQAGDAFEAGALEDALVALDSIGRS